MGMIAGESPARGIAYHHMRGLAWTIVESTLLLFDEGVRIAGPGILENDGEAAGAGARM